MLDYAEKEAKKYGIKVTSFLAFMNRAKNMYQEQINRYNAVEDTVYENIMENSIETVDKNVTEGKYSPKRRTSVIYNKNNKDKLMILLRLGFNLDIILKNFVYDKNIVEILKTSNSTVKSDNILCKILIKLFYTK